MLRSSAVFPILFIGACTPDADIPSPREDVGDTNAPPDLTPPIALCTVSANPIRPPFETAFVDGSQSYAPAGGSPIVAHEWSITEAPAGSTVALFSRTDTSTALIPLLAGRYRIELAVINTLGLRSQQPCIIDFVATPVQGLWVEMFWTHSGEDMDLHLLRPEGTIESDDDCYWVNCDGPSVPGGVDWGVPGATEDDPALLSDDLAGTGPELITLSGPEPGEYTIVVHDYPGSVRNAPTGVTVNVYLDGSQVYTDTRSISGEATYTQFAHVNPTTGVVTPL